MSVDKGLVIREPWIDLILSGQKTWEMRSQSPSYRGWIGLIRKGSGQVSAIARLESVGSHLSPAQMIDSCDRHRIPAAMIESGEVAKWNTPWKLADLRLLPRPVPYRHPYGAITLFNLDAEAKRQIDALLGESLPRQVAVSFAPLAMADRAASPKRTALAQPADVAPTVPARAPLGPNTLVGEVEITEGNLTNNHFYLRQFLHRFPSDLVGGRDLPQPALAHLEAEGMTPTSTDICPRHRFFRDRSWTRRFFAQADATPGDVVQVRELSPYRYQVSLNKKACP